MSYCEKDKDNPVMWKFKCIVAHQGPDYQGSSYNVRVKWENGEITDEPLITVGADDPVTCAIYAREHGLLDMPGWKRFKGIVRRQKKLF